MKDLTLQDWITSSGRYPERAKSFELTAAVIKNAKVLLERVNLLLLDLGVDNAVISSGFRTSYVNAQTPNAAKKSAHMSGEAVDLAITHDALKKIPLKKLEEHNLYMESNDFTATWRHLQTRVTKSGKRVFIP